MRHALRMLFTALMIAMFTAAAGYAEEPVTLVIGSGGEGGTYFPVIEEAAKFCDCEDVVITHNFNSEGKSVGGSDANKRNLLKNKIMGGIIQADVAHLEKRVNAKMKRFLALLPLHEENVHVIVPLEVQVLISAAVKGKAFGYGAKEAVYGYGENDMSNLVDLAGRRVTAWGGSITSSKVIKLMADIGFEIVPAENREEAMTFLESGQVDAILAVAGAPVAWIEELPARQFKLLAVLPATAEKLKDIYGTAGVSYDNFGTMGQAINTLTVDAILFTRTYRTPRMVNALTIFQKCIREKIFAIQDKPGTHPIWQEIDPNREVKWDRVFGAKEE